MFLLTGAANEKEFEQPDWEKIEELFGTFEDWNHQLRNSSFESWTVEQAAFDNEEPQP